MHLNNFSFVDKTQEMVLNIPNGQEKKEALVFGTNLKLIIIYKSNSVKTFWSIKSHHRYWKFRKKRSFLRE